MKLIKNDKIYFFDSMRATLIILIIITHVLQTFNPQASWLIYHTDHIHIAPFTIHFLMLFALQSFFIMSGYLAAMSIKKIGIKKFLNTRVKRVLIPIIVTALTLNVLQAYLLNQFGGGEVTLYTYFSEGKWVSHLWFLIDLTIFFILTYLAVVFLTPVLKKINYLLNTLFEKNGIYIIFLIFSLIILLLIILFSILSPYLANQSINISSIFFYFPFFILGAVLFTNQKIFQEFIQVPIVQTLFMTALFLFIALYFSETQSIIGKMIYYFSDVLSNILASALCFTLFYKFFNKESKIFSFLADASFSIYLFHHILVVSLGLLLIKVEIGGYIGFFILFGIVMIISISIHHFLISKISLLAFLYNGKALRLKKKNHG